jgi:hypothetical protein
MSDTSPKNQKALQHGGGSAPPRQPKPGEEVWRLRDAKGDVQSCELRDDSTAGAGWDVMLLENDEPLFSRRCVDERGARFVAQSFKQDLLRTDYAEAESKTIEKDGL